MNCWIREKLLQLSNKKYDGTKLLLSLQQKITRAKVRTLFLIPYILSQKKFYLYFYHLLRTFSFIHMTRRVLRDNSEITRRLEQQRALKRSPLNNKCGYVYLLQCFLAGPPTTTLPKRK